MDEADTTICAGIQAYCVESATGGPCYYRYATFLLRRKKPRLRAGSTDIIPNINTLINAFSRAERPIFATYYAATPDEAPAMAAFWRHLLPPDDPATQIDPRIKLPENASVFRKPTYSAFVGTDFGRAVLATGVEQVVVCGVMTHLCVETAAREFFCRGVVPFIPADATATIDKDVHVASLRAAAHGFAVVTTTAQILNAFGVSAD